MWLQSHGWEPAFEQKWLFVNKGPAWRRWELVNLGGYKWIMWLSSTHSPKLSVYKNQLRPTLNGHQTVHTDPQELSSSQGESPETIQTPGPFSLLNEILRLVKALGLSVQIKILQWEVWSRVSAENLHSQDTRPAFSHRREMVLENPVLTPLIPPH